MKNKEIKEMGVYLPRYQVQVPSWAHEKTIKTVAQVYHNP